MPEVILWQIFHSAGMDEQIRFALADVGLFSNVSRLSEVMNHLRKGDGIPRDLGQVLRTSRSSAGRTSLRAAQEIRGEDPR